VLLQKFFTQHLENNDYCNNLKDVHDLTVEKNLKTIISTNQNSWSDLHISLQLCSTCLVPRSICDPRIPMQFTPQFYEARNSSFSLPAHCHREKKHTCSGR
jgi:hypothetical protein